MNELLSSIFKKVTTKLISIKRARYIKNQGIDEILSLNDIIFRQCRASSGIHLRRLSNIVSYKLSSLVVTYENINKTMKKIADKFQALL